jgi:hypothetical protein
MRARGRRARWFCESALRRIESWEANRARTPTTRIVSRAGGSGRETAVGGTQDEGPLHLAYRITRQSHGCPLATAGGWSLHFQARTLQALAGRLLLAGHLDDDVLT